MPHEEIRVALDLSDAVALIEQQQQEIAALKAEADALLKKLERSNDAWIRGQKEIAKLKAEVARREDGHSLRMVNESLVDDLHAVETSLRCQEKIIARLQAEIERLKFGREPLPCPRADK